MARGTRRVTVARGIWRATVARGTRRATVARGTWTVPAARGALRVTAARGILRVAAARGSLRVAAARGSLRVAVTRGILTGTVARGVLRDTVARGTLKVTVESHSGPGCTVRSQNHKVTSASGTSCQGRQAPHLAAGVRLAQNICLPKESACRGDQASSLAEKLHAGQPGHPNCLVPACRLRPTLCLANNLRDGTRRILNGTGPATY